MYRCSSNIDTNQLESFAAINSIRLVVATRCLYAWCTRITQADGVKHQAFRRTTGETLTQGNTCRRRRNPQHRNPENLTSPTTPRPESIARKGGRGAGKGSSARCPPVSTWLSAPCDKHASARFLLSGKLPQHEDTRRMRRAPGIGSRRCGRSEEVVEG